MTTATVAAPPRSAVDGLEKLRRQYGCGPVQFAGTDEALDESLKGSVP